MKTSIHKHKLLYIALFIIFLSAYLSKYWIQFTLIQGDSMLPTYHNWQLVLIDKHTTNFDYGDVIVFTNDSLKATLVKRIVALPGDTVQIIDGIVYVNEQPCPFLSKDARLSYSGIASSALHLSNDEYFVLGDNYEVSKDSRYEEIGFIKRDVILGKILD